MVVGLGGKSELVGARGGAVRREFVVVEGGAKGEGVAGCGVGGVLRG